MGPDTNSLEVTAPKLAALEESVESAANVLALEVDLVVGEPRVGGGELEGGFGNKRSPAKEVAVASSLDTVGPNLVEGGEGVLHGAFLGFLRGEGHLSSQTAGDWEAIIRGGCADGRERCCGFGG